MAVVRFADELVRFAVQGVPEGSVAVDDFAQFRAGTCTRWSLRARHSIPSRETRKDRTGAGGICYK